MLAAALLAGGILLVRGLHAPPENPRLAALLEDADSLRGEAERCAEELAEDEAGFRDFDRHVDSLRAEVAAHESSNGRRAVAAADYAEYLEVFDRFNEAVPAWHARADSLRARWERCRALAERHNEVLEAAAAERYGTARTDG
jgi:hypothetical protein